MNKCETYIKNIIIKISSADFQKKFGIVYNKILNVNDKFSGNYCSDYLWLNRKYNAIYQFSNLNENHIIATGSSRWDSPRISLSYDVKDIAN